MKPLATIFIPTKNAGPELGIVLERIFEQKEKNIEVVIIDSGSQDETLKIASSFPTRIHEIRPKDFGHGKTRNLALEYANSDYIVFLSQDAIPKEDKWLSNLLSNFNDKNVAGVFSRQIPRKGANEIHRFFYKYYFPQIKLKRPKKDFNSIQNRFFSNVSSCIKKDVLQRIPFNDSILTTEDQEWAKRVIAKGYNTIYEPKSLVIHSHDHNLVEIFKGYFDSSAAMSEITKDEYNQFKRSSKEYLIKEFLHIFQHKPLILPYWIMRNIVKVSAIFFGLNQKRLPLFLKRSFSLNKYYW